MLAAQPYLHNLISSHAQINRTISTIGRYPNLVSCSRHSRVMFEGGDGILFDSVDKLHLRREDGEVDWDWLPQGQQTKVTDIQKEPSVFLSLACRSATVHIIMLTSLLFRHDLNGTSEMANLRRHTH